MQQTLTSLEASMTLLRAKYVYMSSGELDRLYHAVNAQIVAGEHPQSLSDELNQIHLRGSDLANARGGCEAIGRFRL